MNLTETAKRYGWAAMLSYYVKMFLDHYTGKMILFFSNVRYRHLVKELRPIAMHFENHLFQDIRVAGVNRLTLRPFCSDNIAEMLGSYGLKEIHFKDTSRLSEWIRQAGVSTIRLDTSLEYGQIIEAFLLLFYTIERPWYSGFTRYLRPGWSSSAILDQMCSSRGLVKFCALMHWHSAQAEYAVEYHYCELLFTKIVHGFLNQNRVFQDHRALEKLARYAFWLILITSMIPIILWVGFGYLPVSLLYFYAASGSVLSWYMIKTMASLQYDREHYEALTQEYITQMVELSRFPDSNPQPVFRFSAEGDVIYMNPSSQKLLTDAGFTVEQFERILPSDYEKRVRDCARCNCVIKNVEVHVGSKFIRYLFAPYPGLQSVVAYGSDITELKSKETLLRNLSQNLSEMVRARTLQVERTREVTILSLAKLAEIRDNETGAHLERTQKYIKALAVQLQQHSVYGKLLTDTHIDRIYKSAPLHDIGKVGVPDSILLKPGKLTSDEFEEIKKHPLYGGSALEEADRVLGFDSFLRTAKDIAYHHHERWDGKGYPFGKTGEEIPICARLMAVADVYDALVSKRPYKEPFPHERAVRMILEGKGTQFDPVIIEAFEAVQTQFERIAQAYMDGKANGNGSENGNGNGKQIR